MQTAGVLLVAVERGAALPTWIGQCQENVSDVFVLVENPEEPTDALLKRVEQRVSLLAESEHRRGLVVLVAEPGFASAEAEQVRTSVADRLLEFLANIGAGTFLLLAEESASLDCRIQLLSMAGNLAQQVRGTKISISVRFGALIDNELPHEILGLSDLRARRTSRRPPPKSSPVPKPSIAATVPFRRGLSNAG